MSFFIGNNNYFAINSYDGKVSKPRIPRASTYYEMSLYSRKLMGGSTCKYQRTSQIPFSSSMYIVHTRISKTMSGKRSNLNIVCIKRGKVGGLRTKNFPKFSKGMSRSRETKEAKLHIDWSERL